MKVMTPAELHRSEELHARLKISMIAV